MRAGVCLDCGRVGEVGAGRCPACHAARQAARDARRGSARQRGYDTAHDRDRAAALAALIDGQPCPLPYCGHAPMHQGQALDLHHVDGITGATTLAHAACNRAEGGERGGSR